MSEEKWKPNPALGGIHVEARKKETIEHLQAAANVAFYHLDQQMEQDIAAIKKKTSDQKAKVIQYISKAEGLPALTVVRKYWQKDADDLMHHLTETITRD